MAQKIKDLAVKVSSYTDRNTGQSKDKYQKIGVLMQAKDGGQFILLDPIINLAAIPRGQGKDQIMVSLFEPREQNNQQPPNQPMAQPNQAAQQFQQPQQPPQNGHYNPDGSPMTPQQIQTMQQGR